MNRILHQLKKDLAQQRWALVGWATLLLVHLLLSGFQILRHVPNPDPSTEQFAGLVASWVVFLPMLFVILAVQSDTPVGTSAFWLTRPLRGPQMLAAKALFVVLLFVILPLAVEMVVLLLRGAGAMTWLLVPEFSVVRLPVVLAAFALGAATQRFLHALTLAAIASGLAMVTLILGAFIFFGGPGVDMAQPFAGSRGIAGFWALAATFAAVAVVQFLTRREGLGRCVFLAGIVGTMILQMFWPWDILGRSIQEEQGAPVQIDLHIEPASITLGSVQDSDRKGAPRRNVALRLEIEGGSVSAGQFLAPVSSRSEFVNNRSTSLFTGLSAYWGMQRDSPYRLALESIFTQDGIELVSSSAKRWVEEGERSHVLAHSFELADRDFERLQPELEELRVTVDVGAFEFERAAELPLRDGAAWRDRGDRVEIVRVQSLNSILRIKIREQVLSQIFAPRNAYGRQNRHPWVLLLVDPEARIAIVLRDRQSDVRYQGASWMSPFLRHEESLDVDLRRVLGAKFTPASASEWREKSNLVIVRKHNLGSVRLHQVIDASKIPNQ